MSTRTTNHWKVRGGPDGLHVFNRVTGLNVLMDEISVPSSSYSRAPRQVSIALTNRCDLACAHCYAPKSRDELCFDVLSQWLAELDSQGTLGVGFGGGEPTLHPDFVRLCRHTSEATCLAVSFTTHGHHINGPMAERLHGSVHFIRVSMDGIGATYESIRKRPFDGLLARLKDVRSISPFGVNFVVNERTLPDLSEAAAIAAEAGAVELLLLPQSPTLKVEGILAETLQGLRLWVEAYRGPLKLCITEAGAEGFSTCDPFSKERGLRAYVHIDARGVLKPSSYARNGVLIGELSVIGALGQLTQDLAEDSK